MLEADFQALARARRAYELGRLRTAALRAVLLGVIAGLLGHAQQGPRAWLWVAAMLVPWLVLDAWGRALRAGAWRGVLAGLVTGIVPMQWLRPCCASMLADTAHPACTMPQVCVATGALVGIALALVPSNRTDSQRAYVVGMLLGAGSLLWLKCSLMLWGESVGLLAGVSLGIVAASSFRGLLRTA